MGVGGVGGSLAGILLSPFCVLKLAEQNVAYTSSVKYDLSTASKAYYHRASFSKLFFQEQHFS